MTVLMMTRDNDLKYFLQVENGPGNVFVTQLGEHRKEEDDDVPQSPIMRGSTSDILQHRRKALQKFQLRKKEIENEQVSAELVAKKQEFKERMEALAQRREALEQKDRDRMNRILEFDTYIRECQQKKERVVQLYHQEHQIKSLKKRELYKLKKELKKLKVRKQELQKKMAKYKKFEDFRKEVTDALPPNFLEHVEDSVVEALIKRHKTLFGANQSLIKNLSIKQYNIEQTQNELRNLREEYNTMTVTLLVKISELQSKQSALQEKKTDLHHHINNEEYLFSCKRQDLSRMLLAINNMAELCYMPHYGALDNMALQSKLDMIQESILRKKQIKEETKTFQSDELTRSPSHLLRERSSSSHSREQIKKQIDFTSMDKLEDKEGKS